MEKDYVPVEGLKGIKGSDRRIRVFKEGVEINPDEDTLLLLEGSSESIEAVRKFLSSRENWTGPMRGMNMVKW